MPRAADALKQLAQEHGVCVRPVSLRRTDLTTGGTEVIDLRCGATRAEKCPPCAKRARRLRHEQCREGWRRSDEPSAEQRALILLRARFVFERGRMQEAARWDQVAELDAAIDEVDQAITESGLRGRLTAPPPAPVDADGNLQEHEPERKTRRTHSNHRRQDGPDFTEAQGEPVDPGQAVYRP
jgi:hypothetical protein